MNFIKLLSIFCLIVAVVMAFAACGEDTTPTTESSKTPTDSTVDSSTSTTDSTNNATDSTEDGTGDTDPEPQIIDYTVKAVDAFGNPLEVSVIVEMFKDGESLGEMPIRKGSAIFRQEAGEYTFEVKPMEGKFYYDKSACVLNDEITEMTVTLYNYASDENKQEIWIYEENILDHIPYEAVQVSEGGAYVTIDRPEMTYFIFTPTRGGIYRFSYEASKKVTLGYFGSPHNVLVNCPVEVENGQFELEVKNEGVNIGNPGGTTQLVIGIRSFVVDGCVLKIERIGDAQVELPWTDVSADKNAIKTDNYINSEFVDFDIEDSGLSVVYNENDGYYHLNTADGPIIYIRITSAVIESQTEEETIYKYLPSFITMCETGRLGKVFYDEDGKIVLKESYNEMFYDYVELCGTKGLYPLNEQLASAIKNLGEQNGWFDVNGNHIFGENIADVVIENAWLFACVYENQKALGSSEKPAPVSVSTADSIKTEALYISSGESCVVRTISAATLTISDAQGVKVVANDGEEYVADENGKISVVIKANQNFTISYEGEGDTVIRFTFVEYFG